MTHSVTALPQQERSFFKTMKICNAAFLIAGTCIGGGMLALPVSSSSIGFWPAVFMMLCACLFMTATGLLLLEATLWLKQESHLMSLTKQFLNKFWQSVCWIVYLFIGYASLVAYASAGGKEMAFVFTDLFNVSVSSTLAMLVFTFCLVGLVGLGYQMIGKINTLLFMGMMGAYLLLLGFAPKEIDVHLLGRQNWNGYALLFITPLMLTTFSFPGIVPSIVPYLQRDVNAVRAAIIGGTLLTFIVYVIWLWIVLGTVPLEGTHGLQEAYLKDIPATECLHHATNSLFISCIAQFFAFFALTTSFFGMGLALYDFLADGCGISKKGRGKIGLCALIAIPTLIFSMYFERAFMTALELSGGIGDALISGLLPALIVWKGRYHFSQEGSYRVAGGKLLLIVLAAVSLAILSFEILRRVT